MNSKQLFLHKGIAHVEDLAIEQFISALRNFDMFEISEKVDGSNIQFGIDANGFYTSREEFGANRMYDISDYPINFATTFQRSAHLALSRVLPIMENAGLSMGDRIEAEVLFGELPNAVTYSQETNTIIMLRVVEGDVNLKLLRRALTGKTVRVKLDAPYTTDGRTIKIAPEEHNWSFSATPTKSADQALSAEAKQHLNKSLDELEEFLSMPSGIGEFTNAEAFSIPLNKRPSSVSTDEWKYIKTSMKRKRQELSKKIDFDQDNSFKKRIKEILLNDMVRQIKSEFGPSIEDGGWIEGVVARNKSTGEQFKIVDKDMFTEVKKFLWDVREQLAEKPRTVNKVETFIGKVLVGLASSLGHAELGTKAAKRHLKKLGNTADEILQRISDDVDFETTKQYWVNFLEHQSEKLGSILEEYQEQRAAKEFTTSFGGQRRKFHYNDEIDKRTLQVFATMYKYINNLMKTAKSATSTDDLVTALVGRQLTQV